MTKKQAAYLFEIAWILPSIAVPIALLVAIVLTAFAVGIAVPGEAGRVDPKAINSTPPFDKPGVRELAPGRYEVAMVAQVFSWTPGEIEIPAGSTVTFVVTSRDVIHGLKIEHTPINTMVVPGQISRLTTRFDRPGEYLVICHEYCGGGHHIMAGKIIVK
ncbi:MAG TPA: cytochrome c oxidase subunit II [Roseiflexaceae bacterium]|nr:cytochrome c oxidase subunit II [Roseiflexaceae bacterium]